MKPLFWFKVLKGVASAVLFSCALLCLFTFIGLKMDDPSAFIAVYANVSLFSGALLGGGLASKGSDNWMVNSLISGLIYTGIVLLPSLIVSSWEADSLLRAVLTVVVALCGGAIVQRRTGNSQWRSKSRKRREIARRYGA